METWRQDLRFAFRGLRRNPGFTVVAVLTLALGIAANTAIFSVVNSVLLRALPFRDSSRLVALRAPTASVPNIEDAKAQSAAIADFAFYNGTHHGTVVDPGPSDMDTEVIWYAWASTNFFQVLGTSPILGRGFSEQDDRVVVLSHALWQRRFASSQEILGTRLLLEGRDYVVIGVMPANFKFPAKRVDLWAPYPASPGWAQMRANRKGELLGVVGRLRAGFSVQQADSEIRAIAARLEQQYPEAKTPMSLVPLEAHLLGQTVSFTLMILSGAVAFVLLIACTNVANLLLARGASRQREFAIRAALGAGQRRLIRQMLTESAALVFLAGIVALPMASWGCAALVALGPSDIPRLDEAGIDNRVLAFTAGVSALAGLLFGLAPALKVARGRGHEAGTLNSRAPAGASSRGLRNVLVVAEFALAVILLAGAGLLIRSLSAVLAVNPGFQPRNVLTMRLNNPRLGWQAMERIRELPGVAGVGAMNGVFQLAAADSADSNQPVFTMTAGDALRVLGAQLIKGRFFTERDRQEGAAPVAIVNESMARLKWPGEEPIGKTYLPFGTVVGVIRDIKTRGLERQAFPQIFPAVKAPGFPPRILVVRTTVDPPEVVSSIRRAIRTLDKAAALSEVATLEQQVDDLIGERRFQAYLMAVFSAIALLLAGVGIYGLMHYAVAQRTREIGIRIALGARSGSLVGLVLGEGLLLAGIGIAFGLAGAFALTRAISTMLFGVTPADPVTFTAVAVSLAGVALAACYIPARKAALVDPMNALRLE